MSVSYLRKVRPEGNHHTTTVYSYDYERTEFVDHYFELGTRKGRKGDRLVAYIRNKFIFKFGKDDYYLNQLDEKVWRKLNKRKTREPEVYDGLFDALFLLSLKQGLRGEERFEYIKEGLTENFGQGDYDSYIDESIKRTLNNYKSRKRLFRDKCFLNEWTHFVTVTRDDEKFSCEDEFRESVKRTFNNCAVRRGWTYMLVFERGKKGEDDEGRLHVHALCNIPDGCMPGRIEIVKRYSKKKKRQYESHENSFFKDRYGINDFSPLSGINISWDNIKNETVGYILKYMFKDGEKVVYSRGVPGCAFKEISEDDIVAPITIRLSEFVTQFLLFDDVFSDLIPGVEYYICKDEDDLQCECV